MISIQKAIATIVGEVGTDFVISDKLTIDVVVHQDGTKKNIEHHRACLRFFSELLRGKTYNNKWFNTWCSLYGAVTQLKEDSL